MKILIGDRDGVDFDAPIIVNEKQKNEIIKFLKNMFEVVIVENTNYFRTERIGDKFFMKEWTAEEYAVLLEIEDTNKVAEMLGRSWMSVDIKRGDFIPDFLTWTQTKGKDLLKDDIKKLIKEFMKEKQEEIISRRKRRKKIKQIEKSIEKLKDELESWDSEKTKRLIELAITLGQLKNITLENFIKNKKEEINKKISQLREQLSKIKEF